MTEYEAYTVYIDMRDLPDHADSIDAIILAGLRYLGLAETRLIETDHAGSGSI